MNVSTYLPAKPRYDILDGLRGVAAFLVLFYHCCEITSGADPVHMNINHGYLAVDFFFILSGYVISYAYDDRWTKMSLWNFCKRRLVRLHPLIIFSTLMGACLLYLGAGDFFPGISSAPAWKVLLTIIAGCLMIPLGKSFDVRGWSEVSPLNGNAWSLYYEYLANILYALFIRRFGKFALGLLVVLSAFLTLNLTLNLDVFGFWSERTAQAYTVIGGWELDQWLIGITRLFYPFFCGLLLARIGRKIKIRRGGFLWASLILLVALAFPRVGGVDNMLLNGIYESVCILFVFPVVVLMGAGSTVSGQTAAACKWLGEISYPLYVTHYAIVYGVFGAWMSAHRNLDTDQIILANAGICLFSVFVAWASYRLVDVPLRDWLRRKCF